MKYLAIVGTMIASLVFGPGLAFAETKAPKAAVVKVAPKAKKVAKPAAKVVAKPAAKVVKPAPKAVKTK